MLWMKLRGKMRDWGGYVAFQLSTWLDSWVTSREPGLGWDYRYSLQPVVVESSWRHSLSRSEKSGSSEERAGLSCLKLWEQRCEEKWRPVKPLSRWDGVKRGGSWRQLAPLMGSVTSSVTSSAVLNSLVSERESQTRLGFSGLLHRSDAEAGEGRAEVRCSELQPVNFFPSSNSDEHYPLY